jgi:hypothetical protein
MKPFITSVSFLLVLESASALPPPAQEKPAHLFVVRATLQNRRRIIDIHTTVPDHDVEHKFPCMSLGGKPPHY